MGRSEKEEKTGWTEKREREEWGRGAMFLEDFFRFARVGLWGWEREEGEMLFQR